MQHLLREKPGMGFHSVALRAEALELYKGWGTEMLAARRHARWSMLQL